MKKTLFVISLIFITIFAFSQDKEKLNKELLKAATNGDLAKVKDLLAQGADINTTGSSFGWTPLMNAVFSDKGESEKVFNYLLEKGANPKIKNNGGGTVLHIAANAGKIYALNALLKAGLNVNDLNGNGSTPLIIAATWGRDEFVKELLKNKAKVNVQNDKGDTALIKAAASKKGAPIVEMLIKAGADVNIKNNKGDSALSEAKTKEIKDLLKDAGATR